MKKTQTRAVIDEFASQRRIVLLKARTKQGIVICIAGTFSYLLFDVDLLTAIVFSIVSFFIALGFVYIFSSSEVVNKLEDFLDLIKNIEDEIYPNSKVQYRLDLSSYKLVSKRTWEGRSLHGNYKAKYTDDWLQFRCTLLDRSRLHISKSSKHKERGGYVLKEKRYLSITFTPNMKLYSFDPNEDISYLKGMIYRKLEDSFPEETLEGWVWNHSKNGQTSFKLKILQMEREYTTKDVIEILVGIYALLDRRLLPSGKK